MPRLCLASGFLVNSIGALSQKECDLLRKQLRGQWKEGMSLAFLFPRCPGSSNIRSERSWSGLCAAMPLKSFPPPPLRLNEDDFVASTKRFAAF